MVFYSTAVSLAAKPRSALVHVICRLTDRSATPLSSGADDGRAVWLPGLRAAPSPGGGPARQLLHRLCPGTGESLPWACPALAL